MKDDIIALIEKNMRLGFLLVGISAALILARGLYLGEMANYMIVDGFLIGTSLISFTTHKIMERQREFIAGMIAMNRELADQNRHMIAINEQMRDALAPEMTAEMPIGRVH